MKVFTLRLKPKEDLKQSLQLFVAEKQIFAGCILTTVGSLEQAGVRFADRPVARILRRRFEIISLAGTLSIHGVHLHIGLADSWGRMVGGHLSQGCIIYTTAEIVLAELPHYEFDRQLDRHTGYSELVIHHRGEELLPWGWGEEVRSRNNRASTNKEWGD